MQVSTGVTLSVNSTSVHIHSYVNIEEITPGDIITRLCFQCAAHKGCISPAGPQTCWGMC